MLKDWGICTATAPGAQTGRVRFGGATEPLVWGFFDLYQGPRKLTLRSVEVKEDFFSLREKAASLKVSLSWSALLLHFLPSGLPCDELLVLFWNALDGLTKGAAPSLVEWRFLWRWLHVWGSAPDLVHCPSCGKILTQALWGKTALFCPTCSPEAEGILSIEPSLLQDLRRAVMLAREPYLRWALKREPASVWWVLNDKLKRLLARALS